MGFSTYKQAAAASSAMEEIRPEPTVESLKPSETTSM